MHAIMADDDDDDYFRELDAALFASKTALQLLQGDELNGDDTGAYDYPTGGTAGLPAGRVPANGAGVQRHVGGPAFGDTGAYAGGSDVDDGGYQFDEDADVDDGSEEGLSSDELGEDEEERAAEAAARGVLEAEADIEQVRRVPCGIYTSMIV